MACRNLFFLFWAASCRTSSGLLLFSSVCPMAFTWTGGAEHHHNHI